MKTTFHYYINSKDTPLTKSVNSKDRCTTVTKMVSMKTVSKTFSKI